VGHATRSFNQGVKLTFQVECVFALKNYLVYVVD